MVSKKNRTKVNWVLLKTKIYDIDTLEFKTRWKICKHHLFQNVIWENILDLVQNYSSN
jgi:hypothetical protein